MCFNIVDTLYSHNHKILTNVYCIHIIIPHNTKEVFILLFFVVERRCVMPPLPGGGSWIFFAEENELKKLAEKIASKFA